MHKNMSSQNLSKLAQSYTNRMRKAPGNIRFWRTEFNNFLYDMSGKMVTDKKWQNWIEEADLLDNSENAPPDFEDFLPSTSDKYEVEPVAEGVWEVKRLVESSAKSTGLQRLAGKLSGKYAQTAPTAPAPTAPVTPVADANYVNFINEFQKMLNNAVAGLGGDAVSKVVAITMPYKNSAAATDPENARKVVEAISQNLDTVQNNLNAMKQFANVVLAKKPGNS